MSLSCADSLIMCADGTASADSPPMLSSFHRSTSSPTFDQSMRLLSSRTFWIPNPHHRCGATTRAPLV